MISYALRRIGLSVTVFMAVSTASFLLVHMRGPEAIALAIIGDAARPDVVQAKIAALGLDRPLTTQYFEWFGGLLRGDLGRSFVSNQPVVDILATRIPVTLSLMIAAMALTVAFSVLIGVFAAKWGGGIDRSVQGIAVFVGALPSYWIAFVLVIVFAINLDWVPATGYIPITSSWAGWASTMVLPAISVALTPIFGLAIWIRSSMIDLQTQDFVRTLRSRGISARHVLYRHVLRNAAGSTIQLFGLMVIGLLGGAIIIERVFALPGVGMMTLNAGSADDIPVVLGAIAFYVIVIVIVNTAVDFVNGLLNPKVRVR